MAAYHPYYSDHMVRNVLFPFLSDHHYKHLINHPKIRIIMHRIRPFLSENKVIIIAITAWALMITGLLLTELF